MSIRNEFKIWFLREWRFESAHWYQTKETLPMAGFFVWCWWAASTATGSTNCASNLDAKRSEALAKQVTRAPRLLSSFRPLVPNKRNPAYGGVFCLVLVGGEHRHRFDKLRKQFGRRAKRGACIASTNGP